jgi:hypothetical protein
MWAGGLGVIQMVPYRPSKLPNGVYICNGALLELASAPGQVLFSFDADFKSDWGIEVTDQYISLPNLFDEEGNGYFPRPVDGVNRLPGSKQEDAIRNITGSFSPSITTTSYLNMNEVSGVFSSSNSMNIAGFQSAGTLMQRPTQIDFDASTVVPSAEENRPKNIGFIYVINLGA